MKRNNNTVKIITLVTLLAGALCTPKVVEAKNTWELSLEAMGDESIDYDFSASTGWLHTNYPEYEVSPIHRLMNCNYGVTFKFRRGTISASHLVAAILQGLCSSVWGKPFQPLEDVIAIGISPKLDEIVFDAPIKIDNQDEWNQPSAFDFCKKLAVKLGIDFRWNDERQLYEFCP
jgi:hypothetical protein